VNGNRPARTGWAGGRPRGLLGDRSAPAAPAPARPAASVATAPAPAPEADVPARAARSSALADRAPALAAEWAPTFGRIALGLVFAWFGYHELEHPGNWTGYVPVISETSSLAIILVIVHGWVLFVLAVALVAGIQPRLAAALATVIMLEIVISLVVTGLTDTALRDLGVLGLAVCLTGARTHHLTLPDG
jgi:uncharacterized membrane protein YphA (DoxX/SURF4 family)